MSLKNVGIKKIDMNEGYEKLYAAMRSDDESERKELFNNFAMALAGQIETDVQTALLEDATLNRDEAILAERGIRRALTSVERAFFAEAVQKQKVTGLDKRFPETIVEDIYRNLVETHPILSLIDVQQGTVKTKFVYGDATKKRAFWNEIPSDIKQILLDAFKELDISASKLSGYIALPKGYFDLGPSWLADYVITFLKEVMSATLEEAIINGDGLKKPLGMMRKLSGDSGGVYPEKDKVSLSDLTPMDLAGVRAALAEAKTDNGQVYVLVNPSTYWAKLYPKLAYKTQTGAWVTTQLPTGENIIQSHAVPKDTLIFGVPSNYLLVYAKNTEITEYKETLAIEDMDLYVAKFFGKGIAKNANAFFVADISDIVGATVATLDPAAEIKPEDTINPLPGV